MLAFRTVRFGKPPASRRWARLALVRALTLVGVFATCANVIVGAVNMLFFLAEQPPANPAPSGQAYGVVAEMLVIPFIGFVFLTLAWIGVAIGLRKPFDS